MVTEESLREKYAAMETADLLEINSNDYTELAVLVALDELRKRKVPEDEIRNYRPVSDYKPDEKTVENYVADLNILQKALSYFLLIVFYKFIAYKIGNIVARNIYPARYLLKSQQANYYMVAGIIFLVIGVISSNVHSGSFLVVWLSGFVISFLFDIGYNKNRQVNEIQEKVDAGKDPSGF